MLAYSTWIALVVASMFVLGRIILTDFREQKIRNEQVLQLLALGAAMRILQYTGSFDLVLLWQPLLIAAMLFLLLIGFWMMGKLGAGDVKLLSVVPLVVGAQDILAFAIIFLLLANAISLLMKRPELIPQPDWRLHMQELAVRNRVPLGVPIGIAASIALILSAV